MEKQKTRQEIDEKYKWDLTTIFKTDEEFYSAFEEAKIRLPEVEKYRGKITSSGETLLDFIQFSDELERKLYKLYYYAHLTFDSDTTNTNSQELKGKIELLLTEYAEKTAFVNPELLQTSYDTIEKYYETTPALREYEFDLKSIYRFEPHKLSEEQTKMLSILNQTLESPEEVYETLTDSDMKFGTILNEDGKEVELTESNYNSFLHSKDRNVRKKAFTQMLSTYSSFKNTIAKTFSSNVDYLVGMAKIHHFPSSLEASLFSDNIDKSVYENVIDVIHKNMNVIYKYYDVKKDILKLEELHLYDIYVDLIPNLDKEYTFEEAKEIVLKALSPLGEEYITNLKRAFTDRWIDVYNNVGKRSGAYSSGFYDTNPFLLLNYEGKLNDVSTLAHELGHSMHTYYSCKNNPYHQSHYRIFVAEVASTTNELLLCKYLLKNSKDKNEKLSVLNKMMELFKATIYRQVMFAEFEKRVHELREKGEVLTNQLLADEYYKLNELYFGPNVVVDDLIRYEWERIPHFYYDFYVYKYAIGLSCACYIVENILTGKEKALENYLDFLKSGGSNYPSEELKIAGIDITKPDVIESAIKMFEETIDEFKKIYQEG